MRRRKKENGEQRERMSKDREQRPGWTAPFHIHHLKSEKGVALVVVLVLSAIALAIMTALIYMITSSTRISGIQKSYKTAVEAGQGGADVFYQVIALRGETAGTDAFITNLNNFHLNSASTTPSGCTGTVSGTTYKGLAAKLMAPTTAPWVGCNSSLAIDTADSTTYDMRMELGTTTKYTVYVKIVGTIEGNSGGDEGLMNKGVVSGTSGEITSMSYPYLYAIEIDAENSANHAERAKLSVLYQY